MVLLRARGVFTSLSSWTANTNSANAGEMQMDFKPVLPAP